MKRKIFITALITFLIPFTVYSQSDTVIVQWSTSWGSICGGPTGNYACNPPWTGSGDWNNGIRTFTDPIPPGNIVTKVEVTVFKVDCGLNTLTTELNGQLISTECCSGDCLDGSCWPTYHVRTEAAGFPGYVYGGMNTFQLIPDTTDVCVDRAEIILYYTNIQIPEICLVTVDTATNKNLVVWEKTSFPAASYNIYRETSTPGIYDSIANVPYNSLSNYLDVSSDPNTQPDRYKISWIDSSGNESGLSYEHKTIHLITDLDTINNRVQLTWDAYEGVSYCNYTIYRGVSPNNMNSLAIVSGNTTTFTDFSPLSDTSCYMIEGVHLNGCVATDPATSFNLSYSNISCISDTGTTSVLIPEICIVTVDSAINKNVVVWEKTAYPAASYNIYKESTPGVYNSIGNVLYDSLSIFIDLISFPDVNSDRYKISAIDSSGTESGLGNAHSTMQLTATDSMGVVNLIWDSYEGFAFATYTIWRGPNLDSMIVIAFIPNSFTTYSDVAPPSDTICYMIEVVYATGCTATDPATNINSSYSNAICIGDTITTYVPITYDETISIHVYPNPFNSTTIFEIRGIYEDKPLTFELYNIIGEQVRVISDITFPKFIISRENLPGGIYIYKINSNNGLIGAGKLVIN
ncbi:MAG: T9SS type A sorting domain-containing protein [Bacteroidetes bacterium]|nr:T9SS type A sorting domain-containing protein [Bacteroidota bacterium]